LKHEVLIFGSGPCALRMAHNLADREVLVWLATAKPVSVFHDGIQLLEGALPVQCKGYAGAFDVKLRQNGVSISKQVAAVAVATEENRRPNFAEYGLVPSSNVLDIASVEEQLARKPADNFFASAGRLVFLSGWEKDSHPAILARILAVCAMVQKSKCPQTFVITGNLKVAGDGLEAACQAAKAAGTVFIKCTDRFPAVQPMPDGRIRIVYWDELTRDTYQLIADYVVVDETLGPDPILATVARDLGLERDRLGFAQGDNVRRMNNLTNRRGIFMAGSARAVLTSEELDRDADQAALEILTFLSDGDRDNLSQVRIDPGRCARCLTCHRICPHGAIDIGTRMTVVSQACLSCGICAAACPARAIEVQDLQIVQALDGLTQIPVGSGGGKRFEPRIALFACARSAGIARNLAVAGGSTISSGVQVIEVPCGGAVALHHLLTAFESGADGVLLCTCHPDNCKSQEGSDQARKRAAAALSMLTFSGMEGERLQISTLAANMGTAFFRLVEEFHQKIKMLGPWTSH
jgi:coenzyme F420-reducing hydrogenase delta subunit/Fe-S-cluster-containing hydrogenase component 2